MAAVNRCTVDTSSSGKAVWRPCTLPTPRNTLGTARAVVSTRHNHSGSTAMRGSFHVAASGSGGDRSAAPSGQTSNPTLRGLCSRRGALQATAVLLQALAAAPSSQAASQATALPPLSLCIERLSRSKDQLDAISSALQALGDGSRAEGTTATPGAYRDLQRKLHEGELGRFWATARSADRYIAVGLPGEKGALAREEADLFALLPERAGPLSKLLKPTWDDADDPLCLVYSCVNDPDAPPSINTLYALKLLHVGLGIGADGDKRVTPEGLLYNVGDAQEKLSEYISIAQRSGSSIPSGLLDSGGVLKGVDGPGEKANAFGPSPLG